MVKQLNLVVAAMVFAVLITVINLYLTDQMVRDKGGYSVAPEIVTLNAADMLMGFVAKNAPDISQDELVRRTRALNNDLERTVIDLAARHNLVVVNSSSILSGSRDITPLVLNALQASPAFGEIN